MNLVDPALNINIESIELLPIFSCHCSSINFPFGSTIMTNKFGIILNNDMDSFDRPVTGSVSSEDASTSLPNQVSDGTREL